MIVAPRSGATWQRIGGERNSAKAVDGSTLTYCTIPGNTGTPAYIEWELKSINLDGVLSMNSTDSAAASPY